MYVYMYKSFQGNMNAAAAVTVATWPPSRGMGACVFHARLGVYEKESHATVIFGGENIEKFCTC